MIKQTDNHLDDKTKSTNIVYNMPMKCPNCQKEITSSLSSKCPHCGFKLSAEVYQTSSTDKGHLDPNFSAVDPNDLPDIFTAMLSLIFPPLGIVKAIKSGAQRPFSRKVYAVCSGVGIFVISLVVITILLQ